MKFIPEWSEYGRTMRKMVRDAGFTQRFLTTIGIVKLGGGLRQLRRKLVHSTSRDGTSPTLFSRHPTRPVLSKKSESSNDQPNRTSGVRLIVSCLASSTPARILRCCSRSSGSIGRSFLRLSTNAHSAAAARAALSAISCFRLATPSGVLSGGRKRSAP